MQIGKCAILAATYSKTGHAIAGSILADPNFGEEMTYSVQTINLGAGVEYDLTTTISSAREIFNVLPDYGGADANITVTWAVVAGFWHIYLYSVDAITGVKVKIIYK